MKPLITTQLIEEYQAYIEQIKIGLSAASPSEQIEYIVLINYYEKFIRSLQSKQSKERQNIVDAFEYGSIKGAKGIEMDGESYLNDNFKIKNK